MPKKLLMNNYSENGLMPVMDGLICWLDGRDGKETDTVWKDRSGNDNDASLVCNFNPLYHEWDGKKFIVKNGTDNFKTGFRNILHDYKTLEFNFTITQARQYPYIFSSVNRNTRMTWHDPSGLQYTLSNDGVLKNCGAWYKLETPYVVTITLGAEISIYINGVKLITDRHNGTPEDGIFYIFCDQYDSGFSARQLVGHYCSFKAYNRALTEKEVKQNYDYEQSIERG